MDDQKKEASVPYFIHEGDMTRMDMAMERMKDAVGKMKSALITVCITLVIVVLLFVAAYTINNISWMKFTERMQPTQAEDVENAAETSGVRQYRYSGDYTEKDPFRG